MDKEYVADVIIKQIEILREESKRFEMSAPNSLAIIELLKICIKLKLIKKR